MSDIKLGKNEAGRWLRFPLDLVTQTIAILARRGAGKTYTGLSLAEDLLRLNQQIVILDPQDVWWGLRSSADGKKPGHHIYIFGGERADLPLTPETGKRIADLIVDKGVSAILSLDHLSKTKRKTFVADFCERLYVRKRPQKYRTPLHLFIDEADQFAPQRLPRGMERLLGAVDDLVRRGRTRGIGVTMITQRPATINKDVLTQIEIMVAMQITSPQDRKAIDEWIKVNASDEKRTEFLESLALLQTGEAWVWSPAWIKVFEKIKVRKRDTFDSSATPKPGVKPREPKAIAKLDIDKVKADLEDVIREAEHNDPRALQRRVRELEAQVDGLEGEAEGGLNDRDADAEVEAALKERDIVWAAKYNELIRKIDEFGGQLEDAKGTLLSKALMRLAQDIEGDTSHCDSLPEFPHFVELDEIPDAPIVTIGRVKSKHIRTSSPTPKRLSVSSGSGPGDETLSKSERKILTALAQRGRACTKKLVGIQSGYSINSGGFNSAIANLRKQSYINGSAGAMDITAGGLTALGAWDPLPTGDGLRTYWVGRLQRAQGAILDLLWRSYPAGVTKNGIAETLGYSTNSGGFNSALGALRKLELITKGPGDIKLTPEVMET